MPFGPVDPNIGLTITGLLHPTIDSVTIVPTRLWVGVNVCFTPTQQQLSLILGYQWKENSGTNDYRHLSRRRQTNAIRGR